MTFDKVKDQVFKMDMHHEIFDLWFEIFYSRAILSLCFKNGLSETVIDECREYAKKCMKERFPSVQLEYSIKKESEK